MSNVEIRKNDFIVEFISNLRLQVEEGPVFINAESVVNDYFVSSALFELEKSDAAFGLSKILGLSVVRHKETVVISKCA